ncbi:BspA family leucine-rich repeat surface protein [Enterococcus hirae]
MKKKYKYLFLSSIVIGNLVTSPVFALTGETSTNETTVSETTPTMENLMEETTKIPSSEETTSSSTAEVPEGTNEVENSSSSTESAENEQETITSSTSIDTSSTENNKEIRDATTDGNWNYHISENYAVLDSYVGSSTDIVVPNEIDGKQTSINLSAGLNTSKINQNQITSIIFSNDNGKKIKVTSNRIFFSSNFPKLVNIDLKGLDTSSVTDISSLFSGCNSLTSVDVSNWDTSSVVNMYGAFYACNNLTSVDVSRWNTSSVTNMNRLFFGCNSLTSVDVSRWNTSSVTDMNRLFSGCNSLTSVDVSNWDTSSVKDMYGVFYNCNSLTSVDVSRWNTSSVTNMKCLFSGCNSLTSVDVSRWNTSSVTDMNSLFYNCNSLTSVDVSNWDTSSVMNISNLFSGCSKLTNIDINNFNFGKATTMNYMFYNCPAMSIIDLSKIKLPSNISMNGVFSSTNTLPLLVKATDPKLLNYNYTSDNRVPIGPSFNANGGHFSDNSDTKYYFEKCALKPTDPKFQLSTFNNYKNTVETPIKDDSFFDKWKLTGGTEPTTNDDLLKSDIVYSAQWIPSLINDHIPSQDVDNVKPDQSSIFGIAYMPKAFDFGSITLQDAGTQTIPLASGDYHVAVRDQRLVENDKTPWVLNAQLIWDQGKEISGAELITTNPGEIKQNTNDGTSEFKDSDLVACSQTEAIGFSNVVISSNAPSGVIQGRGDSVHNAVYDYNLGEVTLKIPETKNIEPGKYSGNVEWNLSLTPTP